MSNRVVLIRKPSGARPAAFWAETRIGQLCIAILVAFTLAASSSGYDREEAAKQKFQSIPAIAGSTEIVVIRAVSRLIYDLAPHRHSRALSPSASPAQRAGYDVAGIQRPYYLIGLDAR
jgi:hypothetical protein